MKNKKLITILVAALIIVILAVVIMVTKYAPSSTEKLLYLPERNDTVPEVPILYNYGSKIVYTTDTMIDKVDYINDCSSRGGTFEACGSTCAPGVKTCAMVCALTCNAK
jgi:hypothetical protein